MPTNHYQDDFEEARLPALVADAPPNDQQVEDFKAALLAKLTLAVGKDAATATDRMWDVNF